MSIVAVVVTYNPDAKLTNNLIALRSQVDKIIVVDNNSFNKDLLRSLGGDIEVFYNSHNLGLATALNQGVQKGLSYGATWILTFDQDSTVTPNFVSHLLFAYDACPQRDKVALVGCVYQDERHGQLTSQAKHIANVPYQYINQTITSGSMTKAEVFQKIGFFRDDFFIDWIDIEYCLRCLKFDYKLIEASQAVLLHNLGHTTKHQLGGMQFYTTNHSALRRYYNARNRVAVYKEYSYIKPTWVMKDMMFFATELLKLLLVEQERVKKMRYIFRGIWHGILGKRGAYL